MVFCVMIRRPPRSTLFPSTPLFRSEPGPPSPVPATEPPPHAPHRPHLRPAFRPHRHRRGRRAGGGAERRAVRPRSEEHTSELQSRQYLVCRLLLETKKRRDLLIPHL